jgi:excisionase family DNA binding protein
MIKNQIPEHLRTRRHPNGVSAPIPEAVSEGPQIQNRIGMTNKRIPFGQRPTCTIAEACDAVGLGRTKLYELIGGGHLDTITIGRRRLVHIPSLLKLLEVECG